MLLSFVSGEKNKIFDISCTDWPNVRSCAGWPRKWRTPCIRRCCFHRKAANPDKKVWLPKRIKGLGNQFSLHSSTQSLIFWKSIEVSGSIQVFLNTRTRKAPRENAFQSPRTHVHQHKTRVSRNRSRSHRNNQGVVERCTYLSKVAAPKMILVSPQSCQNFNQAYISNFKGSKCKIIAGPHFIQWNLMFEMTFASEG